MKQLQTLCRFCHLSNLDGKPFVGLSVNAEVLNRLLLRENLGTLCCSMDLFVPHVGTALTRCHAFAVIGPFTWNGFLHDVLNSCISPTSSRALSLKVSPVPPASALKAPLHGLWCAVREFYKFLKYDTVNIVYVMVVLWVFVISFTWIGTLWLTSTSYMYSYSMT